MTDVELTSGAGARLRGLRATVTRRTGVLWGPPGDVLTGWRRPAFLAGALLTLLLVLAVHGFLPGSSQTPLTALFGTGAIQCLHDQGLSSLWTWCMALGLPVGAPRLTGLPEVYTGWVLSYLPGVDAWWAHQVSKGAFDIAAFVGAFLLMRRWRIPRWIALLAVVGYLTAPNVIVLNGFPYTFIGYLLLPAFVWGVLRTLDWFESGRAVLAVSVSLLLSTVMVFTDGYAFFSWALVAACFALGWALRRARGGARLNGALGLASWAISLAGAALLYSVWVPGDAYETAVPLMYFGLLAVDVVTLFVPSSHFLFPRLVGITPPQLATWGITDTAPTSYLGYVTLGLVAVYLVMGRGRPREARRAELVVLAIAGAAALVLSLGPTLKVGQTEPGLDSSLLTLPTSWLYESFPGISEMRATNRWLIVTRLACIALAAAGLSTLWVRAVGKTRWRQVLVVVVAVLMVLETAPNLWRVVQDRRNSIVLVTHLRDGIVDEAGRLLRDDELVLVLPSINDFLANYLVPMAGVRSYNVGGDKNYHLSTAEWPDDLLAARDNYGAAGNATYLCWALDSSVDAIVLPYMNPYTAPLLLRQDAVAEADREELARTLADDPRFDADVGEWMTVLRRGQVACEVEP